MAISETSHPVRYPYPYQTVFTALQSGLRQTRIRLTYWDPAMGYMRAERSMTLFTWGQNIQIYLQAPQANLTVVTVYSSLKFGLADWGTNQRNFRDIFSALDMALRAGAGQPPMGSAPHQDPHQVTPPPPGQPPRPF